MVEGTELADVHLLDLPLRTRTRYNRHTEGLLRELALVRIGVAQGSGGSLPARLLELAGELEGVYAPFRDRPRAAMDAAEAAGSETCDVTYTVPAHAATFARHLLSALEEADDFCRTERHLLTLPAPEEVVAYRRWALGEFTRQLAGEAPRPWQHPLGAAPAAPFGAAPGAPAAPEPAASDGRADEEGAVPARAVGGPLRLEPAAEAVSAARRHVRTALRALDADELEEAAELGVSELVTNVLLHARTACAVAVRPTAGGRVRIEVTDTSAAALQLRSFGITSTTGRGLQLVAALAADWGVEPLAPGRGPGKTVWFEPREDAAVPGAAAVDWAAELDDLL